MNEPMKVGALIKSDASDFPGLPMMSDTFTNQEIIFSKNTFEAIRLERGEEELRLWLLEKLTKVQMMYQEGDRMTKAALVETVESLVEYWDLRAEEFLQALKFGVRGRYGSVYKLKPDVICDWLDKYLEEERLSRRKERDELMKEAGDGMGKSLLMIERKMKGKKSVSLAAAIRERLEKEGNFKKLVTDIRKIQKVVETEEDKEKIVSKRLLTFQGVSSGMIEDMLAEAKSRGNTVMIKSLEDELERRMP